jgi:hypothetical protein
MANQNNSVFTPQDTGGPFSEYLSPTQVAPAQIPVPGAKIPRAAAAAAIIDKFLEGMEKGRVEKFSNQERQRSQKRQALDSAYAQIRQDHEEGRVTEEGYNKATQIYFQGIGNIGVHELQGTASDPQANGKPSKAKKKPADSDQPPTPGDHIKNVAKSIFTGMTGGKLTPTADVGQSLIAMQNSVYSKDGNPLPQYNAKTKVADVQNQLQKLSDSLKPETTQQEAQRLFQPYFKQLDALDPTGKLGYGKQARQDFLSPFQPAPPPGSQAEANVNMQKMFPPITPGTPPPPGAETASGPPPMNGQQLAALRSAKQITKEGNISYIGADGKRTEDEGIRVNVPNRGEFWYVRDQQGNPVAINQAGVREASTGQQSTDAKPSEVVRIGAGQKDAFGKPIPEGSLGRWMTVNGNTGWYRTNESGPQAKAESAERLYRESHQIPDGQDLTEKQKADAQEQWAVLTDPAKKSKYGGATSNKSLNKVANENPLFDIQAWDFLTKGTFDVRGIGKDAGQAAEQITARAQQIMKDNGLTAGDVIALRAGVKADTGALARVTTQGATVNQLEDQLTQNMTIAKKLDAAFKRSDTPFMNRIQAAFNTGTGDSEALNLAAQLHAVSREWAKLMQGQTSAAGVSIKEAAETDKLMSNAMASGQLQSLFSNVISKDANTRSQAVANERKRLVDSIRGALSPPGANDQTPNPQDKIIEQNSGHPPSWFLGGGGESGPVAGTYDPATGQLVIKH